MANLIIKPTSGGSLILQDEGGTAAHTIDASGNHTLSGTNNLGTIAATTTFPAGHVIQQVSTLYDPGNSNVSTSSTSFQASAFFLTITPTNAANDICMCFHVNGFLSANSGANAIIEIQRSINGGSYARMGGSNTYGFAHTYNTEGITSAIFFTDTNFSAWTTGTIVYKLYFRTDNGSHACTFVRADTSNSAWAMEIKR